MDSSRRSFLKSGVGAASIGWIAGCMEDIAPETTDNEEEFPTRDLRLIIPFGPGGGYDEYTRLVAPYIEKHLSGNINVQVQNIDGAGGQVATEEVYNANTDGYTMMIINVLNFSFAQISEDVDYDLREMSYFGQIALEPHLSAVGTNTDIETWDGYIAALQEGGTKMYATSTTSTDVIGQVLLGDYAGLWPPQNILDNLVTYDGRGAGIQGILAGDIEIMASAYSSIFAYIQSGDLRPIIQLTTDAEPRDSISEAETLSSANVAEAEKIEQVVAERRVFAGPPNVPDDRVSILRDAFKEAINDEDFRAEAEQADRDIEYGSGKEARDSTRNAVETWINREDLVDAITQNKG